MNLLGFAEQMERDKMIEWIKQCQHTCGAGELSGMDAGSAQGEHAAC